MKDVNIVSSYHHGFAGGSKNTSRLLHFLTDNGCNVEAYLFECPQYFQYTKTNVKVNTLGNDFINSEVIERSVLKNYSAANNIIDNIKERNDFILFATNLFPYCNILHDVKAQLCHNKKSNPKLIIHPVGSDIWQVGAQMPSRVKWLLESPLVNCIVSYSESFINEIKEYFSIIKEIGVLPPILEDEKFFQINELNIQKRRESLGINDAFVMHTHSSMRKIKCPEIVLKIALKASQIIPEKCVLIMVGPIAFDMISELGLQLIKLEGENSFQYKSCKSNLTIYWTGIVSNVEYYLQISHVELNASLHDSFNLSLMEAMACGVPIVSSSVVGISEHISSANAGYLFPTKKLNYDELNKVINCSKAKDYLFDIDYAIDAVVSIAKNKTEAKERGNSGAAYVLDEFSHEKALINFHKYLD